MSEMINDAAGGAPFVSRATDPVVSNVNMGLVDFAAQFPTPLDPTEVINLAEEATLYSWIPAKNTMLQAETWRELTSLAYMSGSSYATFADGACPEEFTHDGTNTTVTLKNVGAKKSLTISDIMHSAAVSALPMGAINRLLGPARNEGTPGALNYGQAELVATIANLKEKEVTLAAVLTVNALDRILARGNSSTNSLEFDGVETLLNTGTGVHTPATTTGSFTALAYDRFLVESPVRPTVLMGHPATLQELQAGYFQLGFQNSMQLVVSEGSRLVPGYNFASSVNTAVGTLSLVADLNFARTNTGGGTFQASIYGVRAIHNGEQLIYRPVQIPLSYKDLAPGCTAISFQVWEKSALVIKNRRFHSNWRGIFTGRIVTQVPIIGA